MVGSGRPGLHFETDVCVYQDCKDKTATKCTASGQRRLLHKQTVRSYVHVGTNNGAIWVRQLKATLNSATEEYICTGHEAPAAMPWNCGAALRHLIPAYRILDFLMCLNAR